MPVDELMQLLAKYPPGVRVVMTGYENGYDGLLPEKFSVVRIALNTGKHRWEEQHGDAPDDTAVVEALLLHWVSN